MNATFHTSLFILGIAFAIVFAALPFFGRNYSWARWSQVAAIIAGVAVVAWGILGLILYSSHIPISRHLFEGLRYTKGFCAGIGFGLVVAVLLARPYKKIDK